VPGWASVPPRANVRLEAPVAKSAETQVAESVHGAVCISGWESSHSGPTAKV
jgi:hypothetical protein